ncbi:pyridine nucleotide-disulfide oxidoreductase (plasmid) [Streptomyces nigrescens]|uniref:Pyridine nucleotide-disulfide oxidoreductase n=1 Tax=Streptomyces nigrescens TaxID=1920 RepID=A0ABM8A805_STRNI|nr:FAD-dependent oxidoreductase [Streptomyces nigrescens]BDM74757.1 pyridine nucleotide-disulfide oxidoreductase [Streptomyces nigrescens]
MTRPGKVVIVGGSSAGLATAEALRRQGYEGRLTLLDAERHLPYDRPPLSKQVLTGAWEPSRTQLRSQEHLASLEAEFIRAEPAVMCDAVERAVTTATGRVVRGDALVIATGLRPRILPDQEELAGVHVMRTLDDALALRSDLAAGRRLVVVGEGVLGAEIAASARGMGVEVTLAGFGSVLLGSQVGGRVGGFLTRLHTERGTDLRLGVAVEALTGSGGRVCGVRLASGEVLRADTVVVAIGARPATEWLEGSGLALGDGVECDAYCRAAPGVYAVGDTASWHHEGLDRRLRLENRTNATEQAQAVAANLLGAERPYTPTPYFWTDQHDAKLQVHGLPTPAAETHIAEGDPAQGRFVAVYRENGEVTGVLGWNMPKQARLLRQKHLVGPRNGQPTTTVRSAP